MGWHAALRRLSNVTFLMSSTLEAPAGSRDSRWLLNTREFFFFFFFWRKRRMEVNIPSICPQPFKKERKKKISFKLMPWSCVEVVDKRAPEHAAPAARCEKWIKSSPVARYLSRHNGRILSWSRWREFGFFLIFILSRDLHSMKCSKTNKQDLLSFVLWPINFYMAPFRRLL